MKIITRYMTGRKYWPKIVKQTTGRWSMLWWDWIVLPEQEPKLFNGISIREMVWLIMAAYCCLC